MYALKGEETSHHSGHSEEAETPEVENVPRGRTPEERYGIYVVQQLNQEHRELLRETAFNSTEKVEKLHIEIKEVILLWCL